jgi:hypothetical protein
MAPIVFVNLTPSDAIIATGANPMNESIQTSVDRTVSDITPKQRHAIEELVGGNLSPDQRVFVLAYRPGAEPTEAAKSVARNRIEELLTQANENAKQHKVTPDEIEAAIAEAIQSTHK